jgi:hypothetical protein
MNILVPLSNSEIDFKKIISTNDICVQTMWTFQREFVNKSKKLFCRFYLFFVIIIKNFFFFFYQ